MRNYILLRKHTHKHILSAINVRLTVPYLCHRIKNIHNLMLMRPIFRFILTNFDLKTNEIIKHYGR